MLLERSELITSLAEAREYYARKLVGAHKVECHGRPVTIVFERGATHLFSDESGVASAERVERALGGGKMEVRAFSVARARLMDSVLPAICGYTVSLPGTAPTRGREKRMLHGPRLPDGRYLRVVLRPGPGDGFTCVSAYPIQQRVWLDARRAKTAKFPP